jgi:proline iminopeptidase|tara:strand:+ start:2259 stop:3209 length:951 start_codon:yes stop_codon:yes gene_type:complete
MLTLYPEISSRKEIYLSVSDKHELWIAEYGNPQGIPAVFLHGGPGAGCESYHPRFFDPEKYRIILFDQRGSGRSKPHASLQENTTQHLIADIEKIRDELNIDKWVVFGGSWGSTLGLAYAQAHANNVLGLVLRGIFLCRPEDIAWFYQQGASAIFPDYWQDYQAVIPIKERNNMVKAYYQRLTSDNKQEQLNAAREWSAWEGRTSTLHPKQSVADHFGDDAVALSLARIECHYFMYGSYLEPNQLLRDAYLLTDIPGYIVHGRYDVVCPITQAYALHQVWPQAEYYIAPTSGHSASEPEIVSALVTATNELATRYS